MSTSGVANRAAGGIAWDLASVGHALDPVGELGVEALYRGESAGLKEAVAQVLDGALDLALLVAAVGRAGLGGEVVVARHEEHRLVEADVVAGPVEDDALQVVVEDGARDAAERAERGDVAAHEALHGLVEGEASEHGPRPAEHHHEAGERPLGVANADGAEVPPVHLSLLAGERGEAQERLLRRRPDGGHVAPKLNGRAEVAAAPDHLEQPGRTQAGVPLGVSAMKPLNGSSIDGRTRAPGRTKRSASMARRTVSWWTPSSVAMVPTFQCSAKKSRRILAR